MDARSNLSLSLTANRYPRYFGNAQKAVRDEFIVSVSSKRPHTIAEREPVKWFAKPDKGLAKVY